MTLRRRSAWAPARAGRACSCVLLLAALHRPAAAVEAAPSSPPLGETTSEQDREEARGQFREGLTLLDTGEYARALACFERAYAAWKNPKILLNIATAQRAMGLLARAANNYARYQRSAEPEPARAEEVEQILATLDAGLARVIVSNVGARQRFWLNDVELSIEAEQTLRIDPGEYTLRIVWPDASAATRRIAVWPGELLRVDAERPRTAARLDAAPMADEPESSKRELQPAPSYRVRVLARADVDVARRGALGAVGGAVSMTDFLRATGGALLGMHQGGWLGLELLPSRQWLAPVLGISAPLFFVDGLRPGISAELGVRLELSRRIVPFARASFTHFPSAPAGYVQTLVIPSLGVEVGL